MIKKDPLALYKKYHSERDDDRIGLFIALNEAYKIQSALYAGSFVHITPSLIFPTVTYVDSYKKAQAFFADEAVHSFIGGHKKYSEEAAVNFYLSDYNKQFLDGEKLFDLLISQYAGFISQACKKYLKIGGVLVANNSHGDADMAFVDPDYELIAVYNRRSNDNYVISDNELEAYFKPKSKVEVTKECLEKTQRGVGHIKSASGYVFRRIN